MNSQNNRILVHLKLYGSISRNQALSMRPAITRLSARIADLTHQGHSFRAEAKGSDYVYHLTTPKMVQRMTLDDGRIITNTKYAL